MIIETKYNDASDGVKRVITWANKAILEDMTRAGNACWVAGGAIRAKLSRESVKDLDLFFPDYVCADTALVVLAEEDDTKLVFSGENSARFRRGRYNIDIVSTLYAPDPSACISQFDFTVSAFAIQDDTLYHHKHAFADLAAKRLSIVSLPQPLATLHRLRKYQQRGYTACHGTIQTIAKEIALLGPEAIGEMSAYVD